MKTLAFFSTCALVVLVAACATNPDAPLPAGVQSQVDALSAGGQVAAAQTLAAQYQSTITIATAVARATATSLSAASTRDALQLQYVQITREVERESTAQANAEATARANARATAFRETEIAKTEAANARGTDIALRHEQQTADAHASETAVANANKTATWVAEAPTRVAIDRKLADEQTAAQVISAINNAKLQIQLALAPVAAGIDMFWWQAFWTALAIVLVVALIRLTPAGKNYLDAKAAMKYAESEPKVLYDPSNNPIAIMKPTANGYTINPITPQWIADNPTDKPFSLPAGELSADMPAPSDALASKPLNLADQPHGLSMPVGATRDGDRWFSLSHAGHILVGGPTGSGKTMLLHGMIMALVRGARCELYLCDGKREMEFGAYGDEAHVHVVAVTDLPRVLADLQDTMNDRYDVFGSVGARSLEIYNTQSDLPLMPLVLVIDELKTALEQPGVLEQLKAFMRLGRAAGIHLVIGTQFPDAKTVPTDVRGNATTRICFAVAAHHESAAILGTGGAEELPRVPGRFFMDARGERVEVQAFLVEPPVRANVKVLPAPFTDDEKKMIQIALQDGGWFKVKKIARELGIDDSTVTATAETWESRGWLSGEKSNVGRPGKNGRQVLPKLEDLAKRHGIALSPTATIASAPMSAKSAMS